MLRSLNSGVSGLEQFQNQLDVIGNNIANSNTVGYKSSRADFADSFSQTLESSLNSSGARIQIGSGVVTSTTRNNFAQGSFSSTGLPSDLYISGEGFFIVKAPDGAEYATRAGDFRVDTNGYLVTSKDARVQGFSDPGLSSHGDVRINGDNRPGTSQPEATVIGYNIDAQGKIIVRLSDNTEFVRGQVLLQNFRDTQALQKEGDNLYSNLKAAGPLGDSPDAGVAPGSAGLGKIQAGSLELSNVDLASEFANLITTQRGFQASARIISTSDEILQELVNLKH